MTIWVRTLQTSGKINRKDHREIVDSSIPYGVSIYFKNEVLKTYFKQAFWQWCFFSFKMLNDYYKTLLNDV